MAELIVIETDWCGAHTPASGPKPCVKLTGPTCVGCLVDALGDDADTALDAILERPDAVALLGRRGWTPPPGDDD